MSLHRTDRDEESIYTELIGEDIPVQNDVVEKSLPTESRELLDQGDVVLPHTRSELLPKRIKIGEESGEAIANSIMKNIGQGPVVSLREPSFKLSHQPQAQPKTDKTPNDQVLTVDLKKDSVYA